MNMKLDKKAFALIKEWMEAHEFEHSKELPFTFTSGTTQVSIVKWDEDGSPSFKVDYFNKEMQAFVNFYTGNIVLPVLLGYLVWHNLYPMNTKEHAEHFIDEYMEIENCRSVKSRSTAFTRAEVVAGLVKFNITIYK